MISMIRVVLVQMGMKVKGDVCPNLKMSLRKKAAKKDAAELDTKSAAQKSAVPGDPNALKSVEVQNKNNLKI
jgi:hypothetical protein